MIVCFILEAHWSARSGGAEIQVRYVIDELRRAGNVEIHYICRRYAPELDDQHIEVHVLRRLPVLWRYVRFTDIPAVWRLLERIKPDAVYTRVDQPYVGAAAAYARRYGIRHIWHVASRSDVEPYKLNSARDLVRYIDRKAFEYGVRRTDTIVAQTREQAALLERNYGVTPAAVIGNFHPLPAEAIDKTGTTKVLWIGNLKAVKRPELFIQIVHACHELCDAEFLMMGKLTDESLVERIDALHRVTPKFRYLGELALEDVNRMLASAHLLVSTSAYEGMPNTFIQGWLRAVPVASLNVDPDGMVNRERLGWVYATVEELILDLPELVSDRGKLGETGARSAAFARKEFGMGNARRLIEQITGPGRRRS